jgi:hypothetical protein
VVGLAAACRTIQLVEGPGRIERAIADAFAANSNGILSVDDLVSVAYQGINRVEKKHRVATIRAADKVAARIGWACRQAEMAGHPLVYYNLYDVRSYTIGTVVRHGHVRPNGWRLANHQRMV